ncbi:hypothetical protein ACVGWF_24465, partial [Enterobacter asburiae]
AYLDPYQRPAAGRVVRGWVFFSACISAGMVVWLFFSAIQATFSPREAAEITQIARGVLSADQKNTIELLSNIKKLTCPP